MLFLSFFFFGFWKGVCDSVVKAHNRLSTIKLKLLRLEAFKSMNRNFNIMKIPLDASKLGEIGLSNDG